MRKSKWGLVIYLASTFALSTAACGSGDSDTAGGGDGDGDMTGDGDGDTGGDGDGDMTGDGDGDMGGMNGDGDAPTCDDDDGDGVCNIVDTCDGDNSQDADDDGVPDACDVCASSDDNTDTDSDGTPDGCDICAGGDDELDTDDDGTPNFCDVCPQANDGNDADSDGVPDDCDICSLGNDGDDADSDGVPDACDACAGSDDRVDADDDDVPDACDVCPNADDMVEAGGPDRDSNSTPDACDVCGPGVVYDLAPVMWFPLEDEVLDTVYEVFTDSDVGDHGDTAVVGAVSGPLLGANALNLSESSVDANVIVDTNNTAAFPSEELTMSFWAKFDNASQDAQHLISYAPSDGENNEFLVRYHQGRLDAFVNGTTTGTGSYGVVEGIWQNWVLTYRASDGRFQIYLNGEFQTQELNAGGSTPLNQGGTLVFGQDQDTVGGSFDANQDFDGSLADVVIWDRILAPSEIARLSDDSCSRPTTCRDLLARGTTDSGVYEIQPSAATGPLNVYCDMVTDGGGWTLMFHFFDHTSFTETMFTDAFTHNLWTNESWTYDAGGTTFNNSLTAPIEPLTTQGAIDSELMNGAWTDVRMSCSTSANDATEQHFARVDTYAGTNGNWDLLGSAANGTSYGVQAAGNSMGITTVWHDNETTTGNSGHYLCDVHTGGTASAQFSFCYTDHLNNPNGLEQGDSVVALAFGSSLGPDGWSQGFTGECGDMDGNALLDTGTYSLYVR